MIVYDQEVAVKLRQPTVVANFSSKSLGLIEAPNGAIVRKETMVQQEAPKKRRGRPPGSKNRPKEAKEKTVNQAKQIEEAQLAKKIEEAKKYCFHISQHLLALVLRVRRLSSFSIFS